VNPGGVSGIKKKSIDKKKTTPKGCLQKKDDSIGEEPTPTSHDN